jgi:hypothetical protein
MIVTSPLFVPVMPRLGLGIHEFASAARKKVVDPKAKPWDDEQVCGTSGESLCTTE